MAFQSMADKDAPESPGGFSFGLQGWTWPAPVPRGITFFLDGTAQVTDQFGRPIRGSINDGVQVLFAPCPPSPEGKPGDRARFASHAKVVEALAAEHIDWRRLTCAGFPQLPYETLKKAYHDGTSWAFLPATPDDELRKIKDPTLRKDALRARREYDRAVVADTSDADDEDVPSPAHTPTAAPHAKPPAG